MVVATSITLGSVALLSLLFVARRRLNAGPSPIEIVYEGLTGEPLERCASLVCANHNEVVAYQNHRVRVVYSHVLAHSSLDVVTDELYRCEVQEGVQIAIKVRAGEIKEVIANDVSIKRLSASQRMMVESILSVVRQDAQHLAA